MRTRDIEVVGQASDGAEAVALARALTPDAILMDLTMPGMGGLEATRVIKAELPDIKVVILTVSEADEDLFEAIRSGAHGYLVKSTLATTSSSCWRRSTGAKRRSPVGWRARSCATWRRAAPATPQR